MCLKDNTTNDSNVMRRSVNTYVSLHLFFKNEMSIIVDSTFSSSDVYLTCSNTIIGVSIHIKAFV